MNDTPPPPETPELEKIPMPQPNRKQLVRKKAAKKSARPAPRVRAATEAIPDGVVDWFEWNARENTLITKETFVTGISPITGLPVQMKMPAGDCPVFICNGPKKWPGVRYRGKVMHAARVARFIRDGHDMRKFTGPVNGNLFDLSQENWPPTAKPGRPKGVTRGNAAIREIEDRLQDLTDQIFALRRDMETMMHLMRLFVSSPASRDPRGNHSMELRGSIG